MNTVSKHVNLSEEEKNKLMELLTAGKPNEILYANIILMSDRKFTPKTICAALNTSKQTVNMAKRRYLAEGADKFTIRRNAGKAPMPPKLTGEVEAKIVALACMQPPEGRTRWTLELLSDKTVELRYIDSITPMSVSRILKKRNLSLT